MSSLFGTTTNPSPSSPIVGSGTQTNFFNALYGLGLTTNPNDGTMMFNSMPAYQGQLTPTLQGSVAQNTWNAYNPNQAPGAQGVQNQLASINGQIGQQNPYLQSLTQMGQNNQQSPFLQGYNNQQVSYPQVNPASLGMGQLMGQRPFTPGGVR